VTITDNVHRCEMESRERVRVGGSSTSGSTIGWQSKRAKRTTETGTDVGPQRVAVKRGEKADAPTELWCNMEADADAGGMLVWEECGEGRQLMAGCAALGTNDLGVWEICVFRKT
jgi:hypothetical protein